VISGNAGIIPTAHDFGSRSGRSLSRERRFSGGCVMKAELCDAFQTIRVKVSIVILIIQETNPTKFSYDFAIELSLKSTKYHD